jgi:hypothetical protein
MSDATSVRFMFLFSFCAIDGPARPLFTVRFACDRSHTDSAA